MLGGRVSQYTLHLISAVSPLIFVGCGASSGRAVVASGCTSKNKTSKTSSNLSTNVLKSDFDELKNPNDPALGLAYWDIKTKDASGNPQSRRCTATFRKHPDSSKAVVFQIFTAKHCGYPPETVEFANSTSQLQIWVNGGYFTADLLLESQKQFSVFSSTNASLLLKYGGLKGVSRWSEEGNSDGTTECKTKSATLMQSWQGISNQKRVACFSEDDLVVLNASIKVPEKYSVLFQKVIGVLETRGKALESLNPRDRELIALRDHFLNINSLLPEALREMAYAVNINFCNAPEGHKVTLRKEFEPVFRGVCERRDLLISMAKAQLSEYYDSLIKPIAEQPESNDYSDSSEIVRIHKSVYGCQITSLDQVDLTRSRNLFTSCERKFVLDQLWEKWIVAHDSRRNELSASNTSKSNSDLENYFSVRVNALSSQAALDANDVSKSAARVFPIEPNLNQIDVGKNRKAMLFSFIPASEKMFLTKKDSGSLLYIFGNIPFAAMSTLDGEPTSGGASITPLPEVGSESEQISNNSSTGC